MEHEFISATIKMDDEAGPSTETFVPTSSQAQELVSSFASITGSIQKNVIINLFNTRYFF